MNLNQKNTYVMKKIIIMSLALIATNSLNCMDKKSRQGEQKSKRAMLRTREEEVQTPFRHESERPLRSPRLDQPNASTQDENEAATALIALSQMQKEQQANPGKIGTKRKHSSNKKRKGKRNKPQSPQPLPLSRQQQHENITPSLVPNAQRAAQLEMVSSALRNTQNAARVAPLSEPLPYDQPTPHAQNTTNRAQTSFQQNDMPLQAPQPTINDSGFTPLVPLDQIEAERKYQSDARAKQAKPSHHISAQPSSLQPAPSHPSSYAQNTESNQTLQHSNTNAHHPQTETPTMEDVIRAQAQRQQELINIAQKYPQYPITPINDLINDPNDALFYPQLKKRATTTSSGTSMSDTGILRTLPMRREIYEKARAEKQREEQDSDEDIKQNDSKRSE